MEEKLPPDAGSNRESLRVGRSGDEAGWAQTRYGKVTGRLLPASLPREVKETGRGGGRSASERRERRGRRIKEGNKQGKQPRRTTKESGENKGGVQTTDKAQSRPTRATRSSWDADGGGLDDAYKTRPGEPGGTFPTSRKRMDS